MSEIEYTVGDNNAIQVTITRQMRGLDVTVPSGAVGIVTPCPPTHFRDNPTPNPDNPSVMLTGRYENTDNGECFCTAQINQAGNYIFGWFQVICTARVEDDYYVDLPAATGYFRGEISGRRANVRVKFERPNLRETTGHLEFTNVRNNLSHQNVIRLYFREDRQFRIVRSYRAYDYTFSFRWAELRRIAPDPRMPSTALESVRRSHRALYQAEAHPLKTEQIRGIRRFMDYHVKPALREGLGGNAIERIGGVHNFYGMFSRIFSERRFLGTDSGCAYHNLQPIDRRFHCSCGVLFRAQQADLVKMLLLNILETDTVEINRTQRPLLEGLYMLAQSDTGEESRAFHDFRMIFGSRGGQPVLPQRLTQYKYECRMEYVRVSGGIPNTGISVGGRGLNMTIRRHSRQPSGSGWGPWTLEATSSQFPGILGIIKAEVGQESGEGLPINQEVGVNSFEIKTFRRWNWQDFPGPWEIFKAYAAVRIPFNIYSSDLLSSAAVIFHGSGNLPAIVAEIENSQGQSIDTDHRFAIQAGFVWMPGYLFAGTQDRDRRSISPRDLPSASVDWSDHMFVCFDVDVESIRTPDGRRHLGMVVAENLMLFMGRGSHLRIDGHTSRTASWWYNNVLSIRRAQFTLQNIVDILGDDMDIPLTGEESDEGDGSVRIFGHGEQVEMEDGTADQAEDYTARRVDISMSGNAIARLGDRRRGS